MYFGRSANKIQNPYTLADIYIKYKEEIEEGTPYDISYNQFITITTLYLKGIVKRLLLGFRVRMPHALGHLQVVKKKMYFKSQLARRKGIDWEATNKYGKLIHHLNEHTNGYKYLYYWDRRGNKVKGINGYKFVPTRTLKRTLAKLIKENKQDYFEAP